MKIVKETDFREYVVEKLISVGRVVDGGLGNCIFVAFHTLLCELVER